MKPVIAGIFVFFASLFAYSKLVGPIPFSVTQTTTTKTDAFTVSGTGEVSVSPDIARVNVGVQTRGTTVKSAQEALNTAINGVSDGIKRLGIDSKDIKTSNYSIYPNYDYNNGNQRITGYNASANLTITVRDLEKANSVIDTATANGANTVSGVVFDIEDKTKAENEARKEAIAEAKKKAENAASVAGFSLGNIINYQESFNAPVVRRDYLMAAEAKSVPSPDTQLEQGSQKVQVTVSLSYELR